MTIIPSSDPDLALVRERAANEPARAACGIRSTDLDVGRSECHMTVPAWMTDDDGTIGPSTLGMLVDATLGTAVMSATPAGWGWGAGFLIGGRTLDLAMRRADPGDNPMRTVDVRASFLRPIPADDRAVESTATVMYRGRRLGVARGELRGSDGRPALLLDATYVPI